MESVFAKKHAERYNRRYQATLLVDYLVGGIPSDPKVAEGWIKKNLGIENDELVAEMVAKTMLERNIEMGDAIDEVVKTVKVNGFKRDSQGLYFETRNVMAAIKEASNICWPKRKWGPSSKGTRSYWVEHVFPQRAPLHLGQMEPDGIHQRFVHTWRGDGIQYEEYVQEAKLSFELYTDADEKTITEDDFATLWACGEDQGIGSSRGVGYGRYTVVGWDRIS